LSSNVGQNYPYTSETETDREAVIARLTVARAELGPKIASETTPLDPEDERHWVWKCPTPGCGGFLHEAGFAIDLRALYVVCDGTCGKTFLR
jgi:hypothetical protein